VVWVGSEIIGCWQQVLDFARHRSVAVTNARRRPGSARYQGAAFRPPGEPENIMPKAKTTNGIATNGATPKKGAAASNDKTKRNPGNATAAMTKFVAAPEEAAPAGPPTTPATSAPKPPRQTKAGMLRARLSEPGGVSFAALIEATGWQAHTLRAALSGFRKEGLTLTRRREGEDTIYAIDPSGTEVTKIAGEGTVEEIAPEAPRSAMPEDRDAGAADSTSASVAADSNA
jgi:Protein of unknown function (DUF3489)